MNGVEGVIRMVSYILDNHNDSIKTIQIQLNDIIYELYHIDEPTKLSIKEFIKVNS